MALDPNRLAEDTPPSTVPSAERPHRLAEFAAAPPEVAGLVFADKGPQDQGPASSYGSGPGLFDPSVAALGGGRTFVTLTAKAGGTRAAATKLTGAVNRIGVCATAADSVSLPPAVGGQVIYVVNGGAASAQVFGDPATSDTINGVAAGTGVALANGKSASYFSPAAGVWFAVLSA